jgi:hypothetical protein
VEEKSSEIPMKKLGKNPFHLENGNAIETLFFKKLIFLFKVIYKIEK